MPNQILMTNDKMIKNNNGQVPSTSSGQVMMIVVMVLSAVMIGATGIAGILTARQIRQTADAGNFSKVLFAADAGLEWRIYKFYKDFSVCKNCLEDDSTSTDVGLVCNERPLFDDVNVKSTASCEITSSDSDYNYFKISSTAKNKEISYIFNKNIVSEK